MTTTFEMITINLQDLHNFSDQKDAESNKNIIVLLFISNNS